MRHVDPYLLLQYYHYQLLPYLTHSTYSTTRNLTLIEIYIFSMLFPQLFLTLFSFTATLIPYIRSSSPNTPQICAPKQLLPLIPLRIAYVIFAIGL